MTGRISLRVMSSRAIEGKFVAGEAVSDWFWEKPQLQALIDVLLARGFEVVGPTIDQGAIVYASVTNVSQLPQGWTEVQQPGQYRLQPRDDDAWFGFTVGPHSWKKYLFPPRETLVTVKPAAEGWSFIPPEATIPRACLGVRACELAAIAVQDRVFLDGPYPDPQYKARREQLLIVAVNCTQAASTCFCESMRTGPRCQSGFDLALTELRDGFLVEVGSPRGQELVEAVGGRPVTDAEQAAAASARQQAVDQMVRRMETADLPAMLQTKLEDPRWQDVGSRCLSCTNCTMVCPTCFCSSVQDVRDLAADEIRRERSWDSCFNPGFTDLNGVPVRGDTAARYRQWLTHKLSTWHDQFGTSGCVGCGRCITWCPVGIDLTEEVAALRGEEQP